MTFLPPHTVPLLGELNQENMLAKASEQTSDEKVLGFIKVKLIQEQRGEGKTGVSEKPRGAGLSV